MHFILFFEPRILALGIYAYLAVFLVALLESTAVVGLVIPGTTFAIFTGFMASLGLIDLEGVIWAVTLGGIAGDVLSYRLGRHGSSWFKPDGKFFKQSYLDRGENFFKRYGDKSILLARFIGPLRPIVPLVAGLVKMPAQTFFIFNILGGAMSALFYTLVGFFFGTAWSELAHFLGRIGIGAVVLIGGVALIGYIFDQRIVRS